MADEIQRTKNSHSETSEEKILRSPYSPVMIPDVTFPEFLFPFLEKYGDQKFMMAANDSSRFYTYRDIAFYSRRLAGSLIRQGLKTGDVFCICTSRNMDFPIAVLGAVSAGAVIVLGKPYETEEELHNTLKMTDSAYILVEEYNAKKAKNVTQNLRNFKDILVFGKTEGCISFPQLLENDEFECTSLPKINPKNAHLVLAFSSGTSGLPKVIVHTHTSFIAAMLKCNNPRTLKFSSEDIILSTVSFCHSAILVVLSLVVTNGATLIVTPYYDFNEILEVIPRHKATVIFAIVPLIYKLLKDPKVQDYDLTSVKEILTTGAPLNQEANEEVVMRKFPFLKSVRQMYGLSETMILSVVEKGSVLPNSVGKLVSSTELKVIDVTTGATLGANECGEFYVRGIQIMKGYLNNPKMTSKTITADGWCVTGDYGYYDSDGNLYITDRIKEMIKTEFHQVSPTEIESLLCSHPAVDDAAVIGIVDSSLEEVPRGYVVLKQGCKVEPAELIQFVSDRVSHYKRLRGGLEVLDQIPRSQMGKIQRKLLQERYYQTYK